MGKSLDQLLAEVKSGDAIGISIVTNQDNGIVSYANGLLVYQPASIIGPFGRYARLTSSVGQPLDFYFSDRKLDIDAGNTQGFTQQRQPFSANAIDKLGVSISLILSQQRVVKFTLISWGNATFNVAMESRGNLLVGTGPAIGNTTDHAIYLLSFNGITKSPR